MQCTVVLNPFILLYVFVGFSRFYSIFLFVFYTLQLRICPQWLFEPFFFSYLNAMIRSSPAYSRRICPQKLGWWLCYLYSTNENFIHSSMCLVMVYLLPDTLGCPLYA